MHDAKEVQLDAKVFVPSFVLNHEDADTALQRASKFRWEVAMKIASNLDCVDDAGIELGVLSSSKVDVHIITIFSHAANGYELHSDATVLIEIMGLDYTDRMKNIDDRLRAIGESVQLLVHSFVHGLGIEKVSVKFIPIGQKCWVTV